MCAACAPPRSTAASHKHLSAPSMLPQVTQTWTVPAAAGPAPRDLNTVAHLYGSTVAPYRDANAGLVGVLMVTANGALHSTGQARHSPPASRCISWFLPRHAG